MPTNFLDVPNFSEEEILSTEKKLNRGNLFFRTSTQCSRTHCSLRRHFPTYVSSILKVAASCEQRILSVSERFSDHGSSRFPSCHLVPFYASSLSFNIRLRIQNSAKNQSKYFRADSCQVYCLKTQADYGTLGPQIVREITVSR